MRLKDLVDKEVIIERSLSYGNNFPYLVKIWKNFLKQRYDVDVPLTPGDAAFMFALHKISRLVNNPGDQDTLKDMINYAWIGLCYDQYVELLEEAEENSDRENNIVDHLIQNIKDLENQTKQEQIQEQEPHHCFWYNRDCIYNPNANWGMVRTCPMGYDNWEDCDFNCPIEIN